jgi:TPR repeat protein
MTTIDLEDGTGEACAERVADANALYILGTRYATGRDVEQDLISAHKWFNLAAMMGHEEARRQRGELAHEMSTADVAEAQRQARAWLWQRGNAGGAKAAEKPAVSLGSDAQKAPAAEQPAWKSNRSLCA